MQVMSLTVVGPACCTRCPVPTANTACPQGSYVMVCHSAPMVQMRIPKPVVRVTHPTLYISLAVADGYTVREGLHDCFCVSLIFTIKSSLEVFAFPCRPMGE